MSEVSKKEIKLIKKEAKKGNEKFNLEEFAKHYKSGISTSTRINPETKFSTTGSTRFKRTRFI